MPAAEKKKSDKEPKQRKRPASASTAPINPDLARFIEEHFRGELPNSIDVYPLEKGRHKEERLHHYDVKEGEKVGTERACELANEIHGKCQVHCDRLFWAGALPRRRKVFLVNIVDNSRGAINDPVGSELLVLEPRSSRPAPDGEEGEEDGAPHLDGRSMMERVFKDVVDRDERGFQEAGKQAGEMLMWAKSTLKDQQELIKDLFGEARGLITEFRTMAVEIRQIKAEEKAVEIDALNAAENRRDQAARRDKETMWTDVTRASILEAVAVVGKVLPGIGGLFTAMLSGKPIPDPPQLTAGAGSPPPSAPGAAPALPAAAEEQVLIARFIAAARAHKVDADHTAAERLFGKDDDKTGAVLEPGVFSREQVNLLAACAEGKQPIEALFALLPDSGKPEAANPIQLFKAVPYLTPAMRDDLDKMITLLKKRRDASGAKPA